MGIWEIIIGVVKAAEGQFLDPKTGAQKKQWAIDTIMGWLKNVKMASWLRAILPAVIGGLIDAAVAYLNATGGFESQEASPAAS